MNGHLISLSLAATTYLALVATSVKWICIIETPLTREALSKIQQAFRWMLLQSPRSR